MKLPRWLRCLGNELPPDWQQRGAAASEWSAMFGAAGAAEVRRFLGYVTDSFLLSDDDADFIRPTDRPTEIYEHNYRRWWDLGGDTLEWERFIGYLDFEYGLSLEPSELGSVTFGEIFSRAFERRVASSPGMLTLGRESVE